VERRWNVVAHLTASTFGDEISVLSDLPTKPATHGYIAVACLEICCRCAAFASFVESRSEDFDVVSFGQARFQEPRDIVFRSMDDIFRSHTCQSKLHDP
jgi:hypothetical protein